MNQNWSRALFPKPLKKGNFIIFSILNCGGGGGGTGDVGGEGGEVGGGVGRGGIRMNPCLINWIEIHGETFSIPSSSPCKCEIKGLYSGPFFPSFL